MIKKYFRKHKIKIYWSAPIIFLVILNSSGIIGAGNVFVLQTPISPFNLVGDGVDVRLNMYAKSPVNAIGGILHFPPELLRVESISRISSTVDLWMEEPEYSNTLGTIKFSGGFLGKKTEGPNEGTVLDIRFTALEKGKALLKISNGQLLASDGKGSNIASGGNILTLYIRDYKSSSPDVNGDGVVTVSDVNTIYLHTFEGYDAHYDINGDGAVSWADVRNEIGLLK